MWRFDVGIGFAWRMIQSRLHVDDVIVKRPGVAKALRSDIARHALILAAILDLQRARVQHPHVVSKLSRMTEALCLLHASRMLLHLSKLGLGEDADARRARLKAAGDDRVTRRAGRSGVVQIGLVAVV